MTPARLALRALLFLAAALLVMAGLAENRSARAEGTWTNFGGYCGAGGCTSLGASCEAARKTWYPEDPENCNNATTQCRLLSCTLVTETTALARIDAYCCGAVYEATPTLSCPAGYVPDPKNEESPCRLEDPDPAPCPDGRCIQKKKEQKKDPPQTAGNPIVISGGSKYERVVDFATAGPNVLAFERTFNSHTRGTRYQRQLPLGDKWISSFDAFLWSGSAGNYNTIYVLRPDGRELVFTLSGGVYTTRADLPFKLVNTGTAFELTGVDDTVETFGLDGKLVSIARRNGYTQTLTYNGSGKLTQVADSYGRTLGFVYSGNRLQTMIAADGGVYTYQYDKSSIKLLEADRLIKVKYPRLEAAGTDPEPEIAYHYEDSRYPLYLTGITDQRGVRVASWTYDDQARAVSSTHANGVDETTIAYNVDGSRTETNALGKQTIYEYTTVNGASKVTDVERQASTNSPAATSTYSYDSNGYLASRTDWEGNVTAYVHDARGLETSRTEADGTALERTITTTWHSTYRVPTEIVEPGRTTTFTYDGNGRLLTRTVEDTRTLTVPYSTNGNTRTWTYTWDSTGLLLTVDGPRTDVTDVTTYDWTDGLLGSVTNALGQESEITAHDARGLPLSATDPNGVVTDLAYNQQGWLTSVAVRSPGGDAITRFEHDLAGQITAVIQPDGVRLDYEYDDARRLVAVENALGERIEYTLDDLGNRTGEVVKSASSTIVRSQSQTFDELERLLTNIGAASQTTTYAYDDNGNAVSVTDPLNGTKAQAFDALDRLISATDPMTHVTAFGYDDQDNLTAVTDARSLVTAYVYDGLGNLIQQTSPDTGTAVYEYDAAGNMTEMTDARGVVSAYSYDAANRLTAIAYPASPADDVTYAYDDATVGAHGIGRLAGITDKSGATEYAYDARGNVVSVTRTIGSQIYTTLYAYGLTNQLDAITYPSGRIVAYSRDSLGRVSLITTQQSATAAPVTVASGIVYKPFGPVESLVYGNGLVLTYGYDQDYRLTGIETADGATVIQDLALIHDGADNITAITDNLDTGRSQTFTYDDVYRLLSADGAYGSIDYTYDAVGNRLSMTDAGGTTSYSYATTANILTTVTQGSDTRTLTYTANGNLGQDDRPGSQSFELTYDPGNRLTEVELNSSPLATYLYNALGERVAKTVAAATQHFHYDEGGTLLAESDDVGALAREYIWLGGLPVAMLVPGTGGSAPTEVQLDNTDSGAVASGTWTTETAGAGYIGSNYRRHGTGGLPPGGTTIDNDDPAFGAFGVWTAETTPAGYEGSDYLLRDKADATAEILVDNTDSGFTATGTWTATTAAAGYVGTNYLTHNPNQLPPEAIVMDNGGAAFQSVGSWYTGNASGQYGAGYLYRNQFGQAPNSIIIDNVDAGYASVGTWATVNFTGEYGASYQYTNPNQPMMDSIIIDDTSTDTSLTGTWVSGNYSGVYQSLSHFSGAGSGANTFTWTPQLPSAQEYRVYAWWRAHSDHATNTPYTIYHDSGSTTIRVNQEANGGKWNYLGTFSLTPGQNHRVVATNDANGVAVADAVMFTPESSVNRATWTPTIAAAGQFKVYAWWRSHTNHAGDSPYIIYHDGGSTTVRVNQKTNGAKWNLLGTFSMTPGQNHRIEMTDDANGQLVADAVMFTPYDPNTRAEWTPDLPAANDYNVYAWWRTHVNHATDTPYTIHHDGGSTTVRVNQETSGAQWNLLGAFAMTPGQNHRIVLTDDANQEVVADAVRVTRVGAPPPTATWTPTLPVRDRYQVYAIWDAFYTQASNAPYTIYHEGGSTTVTANQTANDNTWVLLGTFTVAPGQNHRVELSDVANGILLADAVKFVPEANAQVARWNVSVSQTGDHRVYAKWPAVATNATTAVYTVTHEGGTTPVVVNQRVNGGQWVLLGSFPFDSSGSGYKVELADNALGTVAADAIHVVKETVASDAFAWTPAIPAAGSYDLYARWTAASGNSAAASYTVVHGGGTDVVTVNQRQNGGQWRYLGSYAFEPEAGHQVTLTASADGAVVADAIRLVGSGPAPSDIAYIHADQLGTPQKLTDAAQAVIWDRVQDPFGRQSSLTASPGVANLLRFPGQLFDGETGFHYNYFRDYDPSTGRYVQSDPIGLGGGINTFAYVGGNPLRWVDAIGLVSSGPYSPIPGSAQTCDSPDCDEEWEHAYQFCNKIAARNGWRTGWNVEGRNYKQCLMGQVSEECGGNPVEKPEPAPFSLPEMPDVPVPLIPFGGGGGGRKCSGPKGFADPLCDPTDPLGLQIM